jgi:hypothetical protein
LRLGVFYVAWELSLSDDSDADNLTDTHHIVLIIRLLVDRQGRLKQGALIDLNQQTIRQFRQLNELPRSITSWLKTWANQQNSN